VRVGLVGCVKRKASHTAAAKDLYTSALFRGRRRYVEVSCNRWFILSAKHELVEPDRILERYDLELKRLQVAERRVWSQHVLTQLEHKLGHLREYEFEVHAGAEYLGNGLVEGLRARGATVSNPSGGRSLFELVSFYNQTSGRQDRPQVDAGQPKAGQALATQGDFAGLFDWLLAQPQSRLDMSFDRISELIGKGLPPSASAHRAYWANTSANSRARSWLTAGWRVVSVDGIGRRVRFERSST
jgi:hypothetical protein